MITVVTNILSAVLENVRESHTFQTEMISLPGYPVSSCEWRPPDDVPPELPPVEFPPDTPEEEPFIPEVEPPLPPQEIPDEAGTSDITEY